MGGGISGSGFGIKPILINIIFTGEVIGSNPGWVNFFFFFQEKYLGLGLGLSQFRFNLYQAIRMTRWEVVGLNLGCVRINFF